MWRILLYALIGYVPLCAIALIFQRKLLYPPCNFQLSEERILEEGLRCWPFFEEYLGFTSFQGSTDMKGTDSYLYSSGLVRLLTGVVVTLSPTLSATVD